MIRYLSQVFFAKLFITLLSQSPAFPQTNLETNAGIQFNFSTPGAANLALGGAFLALADDATAAYTNPAGLTNLVGPHLHLEIRGWNYTHIFTDGGGINDPAGLEVGEEEDQVEGISFLSYVYPRERWALAFYRHELANFEANFKTQGAFLEPTRSRNRVGFPVLQDGRLASLRNQMSLNIINHGTSLAYKFNEAFSLGLSMSYSDLYINSSAERFIPDFPSVPSYTEDELASVQTQIGEDSDMSLTVGFTWEDAKKVWSVGGVYRQGPKFAFKAISEPRGGQRLPGLERSEQNATFHVPDVYGLGIAFQPTDRIRVALDYDRVEYSDLIEDFIDIFNVEEEFGVDPELSSFRINDADEYHFGFEYMIPRDTRTLFIRLGTWYDPDHSLSFHGENPGLEAVYKTREDEIHYSVGVGFYLGQLKFDTAFEYSERLSIGSISMAYHF